MEIRISEGSVYKLIIFGKCARVPIFRLLAKLLSSFQTKRFKCSYSEKYTSLNLSFGKYLKPRKELKRFAWSKLLQKYWTGITFGHLSWFLWTKTSIFFYIMFTCLQNFKKCRIFIVIKTVHCNKNWGVFIHLCSLISKRKKLYFFNFYTYIPEKKS